MTLGDENTVKWIDTMLKALTVENKKFTRVDLQRRVRLYPTSP